MSSGEFIRMAAWPCLLLLLFACTEAPKRGADAGTRNGPSELITATCGSCHAVPDPTDLPRDIWDTIVFPRMGQFLGRYGSPSERERLLSEEAAGIYPPAPLVSDADWATIRSHYLNRAPAAAPPSAYAPAETSALFKPRYPQAFLSPPSTSFVQIREGGLLAADINKSTLLRFDAQLEPRGQFSIGRGLTAATGFAPGDFATVIGSFSPTDVGTGSLLQFTNAGPIPIGTGLRRPTSLAELPDGSLLVTEYGKWTGRLGHWYQKENEWQMKTLADRPGALGVVLDTTAVRPTAYVLFGQGREEIVEYVRQTDGNWQSRVLLSFPPSYGSSSLQLTDWNGDGQPDLLYTNGDNADYVSSVKAYHGIRVFVREDAGFSEALFLPLPGAYGARVADFDADGDLDVAAISFFPDYRQTKPGGIVLYAQDPAGTFTAHPLADADRGRWLTLHSGDLDGDGDLDLVAGNLALEPVPDGGRLARWIKEGLPFLVWKNQLYQ